MPPAALVRFLEPWSQRYGDHPLLSTVIVFGHVAALVFAGGMAVTLDRATLRASRGSSELRWRQLKELATAHRLVLVGLTLSVVTGILMLAADVEAYFGSWVFWGKLAMIAALLVNGWVMMRTETRIGSTPNAADAAGWATLRVTAAISIVLWFAIAFAGVALVNFS
jgi:hypothetical protein